MGILEPPVLCVRAGVCACLFFADLGPLEPFSIGVGTSSAIFFSTVSLVINTPRINHAEGP